ncbi:MAG: hypothetical protein AAFO03_02330 [Bacteroidota bacterium]
MRYINPVIRYCCFCLLALVVLQGCELGAENEGFQYDPMLVREDGQALIVTDDMLFKVQYTPLEWQAKQADAPTLDQYLGHVYFQMKIQPRTAKHNLQGLMADASEEDQATHWNDFLFRQKEKFTLLIGDEELPCVLYHVTPTGLSGQGATLNLVFKDNQPNRAGAFAGTVQLYYQDDLWTQSLLSFDFMADELNQLPLPEFDNN